MSYAEYFDAVFSAAWSVVFNPEQNANQYRFALGQPSVIQAAYDAKASVGKASRLFLSSMVRPDNKGAAGAPILERDRLDVSAFLRA